MKKSTRTILLIGIFTLSFGIVLSTIGFFSAPSVISKIGYEGLWNASLISLPDDESSADYNDSNTYHIDTSHVENLSIDWVSGNVTIIPYNGDQIKVTESSKGKITEKNALQIRQEDDTIQISYSKQHFSFGFGFFGSSRSKKLEVKIPKEMVDDITTLEFSSTSADLKTRGLDLAELSTDTTSGTIDVADTNVSDLIEVSSVSGDLILDNVKTNELSMDSTSGKIDGSNVKAIDVTMSTVSGEMEIGFINCPSTLSMDSTSGDVTVSLPKGSGVTISSDSTSGSISTDFDTKIIDEEYIIGNGNSMFEISTVSGDMRIRKN